MSPNDSVAGAAFARTHACATSRTAAVANPFACVTELKFFVPCTTAGVDAALSRIEEAEKLDEMVKRHLGHDRESLLDRLIRGPATTPAPAGHAPAAWPQRQLPAGPAPACPAWPPATPIMPPPSFPPPAAAPAHPPAKKHRPVVGFDTVVAMVQQKHPGTTHADAKARTVAMPKGRCTCCAELRSGAGRSTKCLTPGCTRSTIHPTIRNETRAVQFPADTLTPSTIPRGCGRHHPAENPTLFPTLFPTTAASAAPSQHRSLTVPHGCGRRHPADNPTLFRAAVADADPTPVLACSDRRHPADVTPRPTRPRPTPPRRTPPLGQ